MDLPSLVQKFRQYTPDTKTDEDLAELISKVDGNEAEIHKEIGRWWEENTSPFGSPLQSPLQSPIQSPRAHGEVTDMLTNPASPTGKSAMQRTKKQDKFMMDINSTRSLRVTDVGNGHDYFQADVATIPQNGFIKSPGYPQGSMQHIHNGSNNVPNQHNGTTQNNLTNNIDNNKGYINRRISNLYVYDEKNQIFDESMKNVVDENNLISIISDAPNNEEEPQNYDRGDENNQKHDKNAQYQNNIQEEQLQSNTSFLSGAKAIHERQNQSRELYSREFPSQELASRELASQNSNQGKSHNSHASNFRSRENASRDELNKEISSRPKNPEKSNRKKDRKSPNREKKSHKRRSDSQARPTSKSGSNRISSQVRLLAEHCFTLSDDAIGSLVKYRIPQQSRWDTKEKVQKRDDLIRHLQEALFVLSQEKQRFQTACADIEMCLNEENQELRQHLAVMNNEIADPYELQQLKEEIAALKTKLKTKEEEVAKLSQAKTERERRISELSTEIMRTQFEKKEDYQAKMRFEEEINRLNGEINLAKAELQQKNKEIDLSERNLADLRKSILERERHLEQSNNKSEEKLSRLETEKLDLAEQLQAQSTDTVYLFSELASFKEILQNTKQELKEVERDEESAKLRAQQIREALIVERALRARAELKEEEERRERIAASAQLLAMEAAHNDHVERMQNVRLGNVVEWEEKYELIFNEKEEVVQENRGIEEKIQGFQEVVRQMQLQIEEASDDTEFSQQIGKLNGEIERLLMQIETAEKRRKDENIRFEDRIQTLENVIEHKEHKVQDIEMERRKLHNTIQELRGNVRVYARVRPFLPAENSDGDMDGNGNLLYSMSSPKSTVEVKPDGITIYLRRRNDPIGDVLDEYSFSYDKAFPPPTTQEEVFKEVSEFVQSALDGYNVCLFSYGQTGSGKTHTMQGYGAGPDRGIIPRAMEQVADYKHKLQNQGWEYQMQISFLEIYNEKIKDLLVDEEILQQTGKANNELNIRLDKKGKTYVEGLTKIDVDPDDKITIDKIMETAALNRSVAKTDMNAHSSRSHSVFTLYLTGLNKKKGYFIEGQLNLCDLAGSERVDKSGAVGDRFVEMVNINKSLSSLSDVFVAIGDRRTHIPFRNSKLTHLLMPALSGDGKTLMMINISPAQSNFQESLSTLRFGVNVNQCELGKAVKNVKEAPVEDINDTANGNNENTNDTDGAKNAKASLAQKKTAKNSPPSPATVPQLARAQSKVIPRAKK